MRNEKLRMKNTRGMLPRAVAIFCLALLLTVFGCSDAFVPQNGADGIKAGYGRVSVSFTSGQARTAFPDKIFSYAYTFTKGEDILDNEQPDGSGFFTLEMGNWVVDVQAYVGEELMATGSGSFTLGSGATENIIVNLEAESANGEDGTFTYTVQFPEGVMVTTFELVNLLGSGDIDLTDTAEYTFTSTGVSATEIVSAGVYLLTVQLDRGGITAGICEAVYVYPMLDVEFTKIFEDEDFNVFISIDEVTAYLSSVDSGDSAENPVYILVSINLGVMTNSGDGWQQLLGAIDDADKFVAIDLSPCGMNGNVFDPVSSVSTGKDKIVSITLPDAVESIISGSTTNPTFNNFDNIKSASGTHVTSIGDYAFLYCSSLTKANFPLAESIGSHAFFGSNLTEANFPLAENIGNQAFQECSLTEANFPSAKSIGEGAFYLCSSLTEAVFPLAESIGFAAFSECSRLTEVNIPLAKSIGQGAFNSCGNLTEVSFPLAKSIGRGAFNYCSRLTEVNIPLAESIGDMAFWGCSSLEEVCFPLAESIGQKTFYNCSSLTEANFPLAESIGDEAFYGCNNLIEANFPSAESIGERVFYECSSLTKVSFSSTANISYNVFLFSPALTSFVLSGSGNLGVAEGGKALIRNVDGSKELIAYPSAAGIVEMDDIISIGKDAFYGCSSLTEANFPLAESICDEAFYGCSSLTEANFPLAESIGQQAFQNCGSLTEAIFPLAESIGNSAFHDCSSLTEANFPLAESIGGFAFFSCNSLTEAVFPLVESIGYSAFANCNSLNNITIAADLGIDANAWIRGNFSDYYKSQAKAAGTYTYNGSSWEGPF